MTPPFKSRRPCGRAMSRLLLFFCCLTLATVVSAQNATTDAPTADFGGDDAATLTDAPTAGSTDAPTAGASTPAPTTASPTPAPAADPTQAPTTSRPATPAPVATPAATTEPTAVSAATPAPTTRQPTTSGTTSAPAAAPVAAPTPTTPATPTPLTMEPTPQPGETSAPTAALVPIEQTIRGLSVTFGNIDTQAVDGSALLDWEDTTQQWFQESFNGNRRRNRNTRLLQSDPSKIGISKMRTEYQIVDTQSDDASNTLTINYDQVMKYVSTFGAQSPQALARLPFSYSSTVDAYRQALRDNVNGFELVSSISVPEVVEEPPASSPGGSGGDGSDDTFWSLPVIIGIAVGGAVVLLIVVCAVYACGRPKDNQHNSGGSTKPSTVNTKHNNIGNGGRYGGYDNGGYNGYGQQQQYQQPATQINAMGSYDDISTMDEPTIPNVITNASGDVYGDQSVATVDYDYSKAYGGGGGESIVSSVGGTLGDNTRYTSAEQTLPSSRVALGASYESDDPADDGIGGRRNNSNMREEIIEVLAPAGKLGVVIDTPDEGAPVVHAVKDSSVIADQIQVGDKLVAVDDEDVRSMTAIKVSKLISRKSANPTRKLTIKRAIFEDDD